MHLKFKYQKINKQGPSLTIPIEKAAILDQIKLAENEEFVLEQFPSSTYNADYCYVLVTVGEDECTFLNTVMSRGIIETQLGYLPSKEPLFRSVLSD